MYTIGVRSLPAISRLSYFDVALATLSRSGVGLVDDIRIAIGQSVEELALRGEARRTRDWNSPFSYRDTSVDVLRELMRWGLVDPMPLADDRDGFERIRRASLTLTSSGLRVATLAASERREALGQFILRDYEMFRSLLAILERHEIVILETKDIAVAAYLPDPGGASANQDGWLQLAKTVHVRFRALGTSELGVRLGPCPTAERMAADLGKYLRRRFTAKPPKTAKELTGAVNKAIAQSLLHEAGFTGDSNAYDRCLRWGRDLFLLNDARYIHGVPAWVAWSAAVVRPAAEGFSITRRGLAEYRDRANRALVAAYARIADAARTSTSQVPLIPIFEVRESAAFQIRVCDEVVDQALVELAAAPSNELVVQLHLADMRDFAPSARPFRFQGQRFYYVAMHRQPPANHPSSPEPSNAHR